MKLMPEHIRHLSQADPILAVVIENQTLLARKIRRDYFDSLCRSIIGQQLSVKAAGTINDRVRALFPSKKFPTPAEFLKMPNRKLRQAGLSSAKVLYMKNLAKFMTQHHKEFKLIKKLSDEEIILLLTQIKGIGRWTAEMFMIFTLGREDIFSHGDLGLKNAIKKLYNLRLTPSLKTVTKISNKWRPYRSIASLYLWASLKPV